MIRLPAGTRVSFGRIGHREPDPGILRQLRDIDPTADVQWVPGPYGRGERWHVGRWHPPHAERRAELVRALDQYTGRQVGFQDPARLVTLWRGLRGWRLMFTVHGALDGRVVREFKKSRWNHDHEFEKRLEEAIRMLDRWEEEKDRELSRMIRDRDDAWGWKRSRGDKMVHTHGIRDGMPFSGTVA